MGMAVDANVLIFERIREELKKGKRVKTAITAGYEKVFSTILDANLTTFITSFILFYFGKGPVKGFALILMIGLASSMFTALYVTRTVFMILMHFGWLEKLKMLLLMPETRFKFIDNRKKAYLVSGIVILASLAGFFGSGEKKYGIDFSGGSLLELHFEQDVAIDELRSALKEFGEDVTIQYFGSNSEILVRAKTGQNRDIKKILDSGKFSGYEVAREEEVGPVVGNELKKSSLLAIAVSLIGIIIYIGFRFELKYAFGAICALVHDVIITAGLYCLMGYEMNVPTIAALLTIVGYSLNDTIVIFDRIRENLRSHSRKTHIELMNEAINDTLARTVLTSLTTLLVVLSILVYGGGQIHDFALTLFIGVIVGTYSSVFVASPILQEFEPHKH
jgi:SecD/SecF fusion protein